MRQESLSSTTGAERTVRDIRRKTRKHYSAEEKSRIVLSGLRGGTASPGCTGRVDRRERRSARHVGRRPCGGPLRSELAFPHQRRA